MTRVSPLVFDEASHTYRLDGKPIPSVTTILKELSAREYRFVAPQLMADAAWLGQAVHKVIELDVQGTLDEDTLDGTLIGYLRKWRQFLAQSGFQPLLSEQRVFSRKHHYAGTLDLFGMLHRRLAMVDAKRCAQVPRTAGPQTAAYETALRESHPEAIAAAAKAIDWKLSAPPPIDRYALQLTPADNPGWQLVPFKNSSDARVFLSAHTLNTWSNAA